jgi:hypothetical protein
LTQSALWCSVTQSALWCSVYTIPCLSSWWLGLPLIYHLLCIIAIYLFHFNMLYVYVYILYIMSIFIKLSIFILCLQIDLSPTEKQWLVISVERRGLLLSGLGIDLFLSEVKRRVSNNIPHTRKWWTLFHRNWTPCSRVKRFCFSDGNIHVHSRYRKKLMTLLVVFLVYILTVAGIKEGPWSTEIREVVTWQDVVYM